MFQPDVMQGQRVLVTGGGSGLGRMMAEAFARLGATVYLCGRRQAVVDEAASAINAEGQGRAVALVCDIRSPEAIEAMAERIWADGGPLTGLVNNAAGNFIARTEDISLRGFDAVANTVFRGTFAVTQACGKRWIAGGNRASVVSILTTWVWNGGPFATPSAMSKAGIHAMTQSLAVEWGGKGIRLNAICPGSFPTEGAAGRLATTDTPVVSGSPMGRDGRPEELANLAVFLLAPGAEYINGQTIAIDGAAWQANGQNFSAMAAWTDAQWAEARAAARALDSRDKAARTA